MVINRAKHLRFEIRLLFDAGKSPLLKAIQNKTNAHAFFIGMLLGVRE